MTAALQKNGVTYPFLGWSPDLAKRLVIGIVDFR
jgi:hypothetical protein